MIDIGRAFKAPFEDKNWLSKTLLGLLWGLLIVTAPAVSGAQLEYIRGVSKGDERLPEWDDFGTKWVEGFMVLLAGLIYFLPVFIIGALLIVPAIVAAVFGGDASGAMGGLFAGTFCLFWIAAIVYSVVVSVLFSAAMTNYAIRRSFGAFFDFGGIMDLVRGNTGYFTAWLYTVLIAFVGSMAASVLASTGVGAILSTGITYLVAMISGHVLGQWATRAFALESYTPPPTGYQAPAPPAPPAPPASFVAPPPSPAIDAPVKEPQAIDAPVVETPPAAAPVEPPAETAPDAGSQPEVADDTQEPPS